MGCLDADSDGIPCDDKGVSGAVPSTGVEVGVEVGVGVGGGCVKETMHTMTASGVNGPLVMAVEVDQQQSQSLSLPQSIAPHQALDPSHAPAQGLVHAWFPHSIGFVPDVKPLQALPTHIDGRDVW